MAAFFKSLGKGLLYVIMLPLGLIAIALYAVYGIFVFFFQLIRLIILFFTGRKLNSDLPEDIKAKAIIEANKPREESLSLYPSESIVYGSGYVHPSLEENNVEEQNDEIDQFEEKEEDENV